MTREATGTIPHPFVSNSTAYETKGCSAKHQPKTSSHQGTHHSPLTAVNAKSLISTLFAGDRIDLLHFFARAPTRNARAHTPICKRCRSVRALTLTRVRSLTLMSEVLEFGATALTHLVRELWQSMLELLQFGVTALTDRCCGFLLPV